MASKSPINYEIGSDFFQKIDKEYLESKKSYLSTNNTKENKLYLSLARQAIEAIIYDIEWKDGEKRVLLPAYTCHTVIEPFVRNEFEIFYYEVDKELRVKASELNYLIFKNSISITILQEMYGFDTIIHDEEIKSKYKVLDITQNVFSIYSQIPVDYIFGSLRKWMAIPDGSILIKTSGEFKSDLFKKIEKINIDSAIEAYNLKSKYIYEDSIDKLSFINKFAEYKKSIKNLYEIHTMHPISYYLYKKEDIKYLKEQRNKNYKELLSFEKWSKIGVPIFNKIEDDIVPLYFPVYITKLDRRKLQASLAKKNIYCPIIWPKPENINIDKLSNETLWIYNNILAFPIDQRYSKKDMRYIKLVLEEIITK